MTAKGALFFLLFLFCLPLPVFPEELYAIQTGTTLKDTRSGSASQAAPTDTEPLGTSKKGLSWDVFGKSSGYIHPFLSVTGYYTDNVFNSNTNRKDDFVTVLSPGVWLALPHVKEKLLSVDTTNISPGGFTLSRPYQEFFQRYQAYLFYNADIELHSRFSSVNAVSHQAEGFFQYNLRGGLSAEIMDQYIASHDAFGSGLSPSDKLSRYVTNLANLIVTYNLSDRFRLRGDYSNFYVNYLASRNDFQDHDDNAVSAYLFYKIKPKTSLFVQYEYVDISYRQDTLSNSNENHFYGGVEWDITAKSKGSMKAGYGIKNFSSQIDTARDFIFEVQIDHKFTPKTSLIIKASRRTEETNISTTNFILANSIGAEYIHRLTGKITGYASIFYENDTYEGQLTFDGQTKTRKDNYLKGVLALQYQFKEWLKTDAGYIYSWRGSNFSDFEYTSNTFFLRLTGSL